MPYERHGRYNEERGLPDNTGQAQGSGLYVWFHEAVGQHWPDLVEQSKAQKDPNAWLLAQLKTMEDEQARAIHEEFVARRRLEQAEARQRDRKRALAQLRERLSEATDEKSKEYFRKRIVKLEKAIAEREGKS